MIKGILIGVLIAFIVDMIAAVVRDVLEARKGDKK